MKSFDRLSFQKIYKKLLWCLLSGVFMTTTSTTTPAGLILLSHPGQIGMTHKEMIDGLPESYRGLPHVIVDLDMVEVARHAIRSAEWTAARRELERQVRDEIEPLRQKYPDYRIVYFGSSPIPLAVHLGYLLETWQQVDVVPHHHTLRTWGWHRGDARPRLVPLKLPDHTDRTPGEAVIRVSTSHRVDPQLTHRVVTTPLVEIDITLEQPGEDAFPRVDEMLEVAAAFRKTLDVIGDRFPGVHRVHLFASVQPGVAFLLGTQISKTMHPPVQTYQYTRNTDGGPLHVPAVLVNTPVRPEPGPLTDEERARAACDRDALAADLDRMKGFAEREARDNGSWLAKLLRDPSGHPDFRGQWLALPSIDHTPLPGTRIDLETCEVEDSFRLSPNNTWQLDDRWLVRLARRIPDDNRRRRALRLLVLHESVHRGPQRLTRTSSRQIGRFPKVLEEIDYHADVWAMLHEHVLASLQSRSEVDDVREFIRDLIEIATETMWAFDEDEIPLEEIQIRRLNRYLIWYWQYLVLEAGSSSTTKADLRVILSVLAQRPLIELAGPPVRAHDERLFFVLDPGRADVPELAVYHEGKLHLHGRRHSFDILELLKAIAARHAKRIIDVLRGAVEQIVC